MGVLATAWFGVRVLLVMAAILSALWVAWVMLSGAVAALVHGEPPRCSRCDAPCGPPPRGQRPLCADCLDEPYEP